MDSSIIYIACIHPSDTGYKNISRRNRQRRQERIFKITVNKIYLKLHFFRFSYRRHEKIEDFEIHRKLYIYDCQMSVHIANNRPWKSERIDILSE